MFIGSLQICLSLMHTSVHANRHTHTDITATGKRTKMKEQEERWGKKGKKEGGEKPMWQREILIFSESADPSCLPPPSFTVACISLPPCHPPYKPVLCLLLSPPTFISFSSSLFSVSLTTSLYSPHPALLLPPFSLPLSRLSGFVLSLFLYSTSLILSHSGRAAGRQKQHTLMLLYLTRHTHSCAPCTTAQT